MCSTLPKWCDEDDFIARLQAHNTQAWQILYDGYSLELRSGILASLRKRQLPEDYLEEIEQKTWDRSMDLIKEFKDTSVPYKIKHWMRAISLILVYELQKSLVKQQQNLSLETLNDYSEKEIPSTIIESEDTSHPEEIIIFSEMQEERTIFYGLVEEAMGILSPSHQSILRRWSQGETPEEIANKCGVQVNTVYTTLRRSLKKLRSHIDMQKLKKARE